MANSSKGFPHKHLQTDKPFVTAFAVQGYWELKKIDAAPIAARAGFAAEAMRLGKE